MDAQIAICIADMEAVLSTGKMSLEVQVRAYDLLQTLLELSDQGRLPSGDVCKAFCLMYQKCSSALDSAYDSEDLSDELHASLDPLKEAVNEARFKAASAASLHEFAKEVFEIWQTSGIFARRRALRELRARAGFRLESHRIGNYVAKTFDLMNEAQARFAHAQQALFAANCSYKIRPGTFAAIASIFS